MLTAGRCTTHGPCFWTPNHHVWYFGLFWVLFAVCGGIWVRNWEEASYISRARTVGTSLLSRLDGQVWFPGVTHRAIKRCPKVWRKSWRTARNLIRFGTIRRVNSLGIKWERQCQPLWAPVRPASRCCTLLVSLSQVSTLLPLIVSKLASIVRHLTDSTRLLHTSHGLNLWSARSLHKLAILELNRCP